MMKSKVITKYEKEDKDKRKKKKKVVETFNLEEVSLSPSFFIHKSASRCHSLGSSYIIRVVSLVHKTRESRFDQVREPKALDALYIAVPV